MNFLTSKDTATVPPTLVSGEGEERMQLQPNQLLEHRVSSLSAISGSVLGTDYLREHLVQQHKRIKHGGCYGEYLEAFKIDGRARFGSVADKDWNVAKWMKHVQLTHLKDLEERTLERWASENEEVVSMEMPPIHIMWSLMIEAIWDCYLMLSRSAGDLKMKYSWK
eukprot:Blabericola_migrator_1__3690@NODE_2102_length_3270_cov_134_262254_g826_i2_p2_GENE_NODE_2102_length_3270_cov_134_262254_g826_i2NODE_2102_length_3270_cov_134_262254_g826_i2_p2_ORF_typecomplete_len166_score10_09_NODE_2102_length_3270_cov_134_262254_g826_i223252822